MLAQRNSRLLEAARRLAWPLLLGALVLPAAACGDDAAALAPDGAPGVDGAAGDAPTIDGPAPAPDADDLGAQRRACAFGPGDSVQTTLGFTADDRARLPIDHVVVILQENRSFDHYLGRMPQFGHTEVDGIPAGYTNPVPSGGTASPAHAGTTCISPDVGHSWQRMHDDWNGGQMDGFYTQASANGDGHRALFWYDQRDLPFYYYLYSTFAMSDRFFSPVLGPTWPNRDFVYAGTSDGVKNTFERMIHVRTLYDQLDDAGIEWGVYADGTPRQDCIGWTSSHAGVHPTSAFFSALAAGTLPRVAFIDGKGATEDEHPPNDVQKGEAFVRHIMGTAFSSPLWPRLALLLTYDEAGGFFDHVSPPPACAPSTAPSDAAFNRMGIRIPFVAVSPWARPGYVSHVPRDATSLLRLVQAVFDLPALTRRDANSDAPLDLFDFNAPQLLSPPPAPAAGSGGCP